MKREWTMPDWETLRTAAGAITATAGAVGAVIAALVHRNKKKEEETPHLNVPQYISEFQALHTAEKLIRQEQRQQIEQQRVEMIELQRVQEGLQEEVSEMRGVILTFEETLRKREQAIRMLEKQLTELRLIEKQLRALVEELRVANSELRTQQLVLERTNAALSAKVGFLEQQLAAYRTENDDR